MIVALAVAWLVACGSADAPTPVASSAGASSPEEAAPSVAAASVPGSELRTTNGRYLLQTTMVPSPPPLSQLFEVRTRVLDGATGAAAVDVILTVDATMPEHGHGMATRPQTAAADGAFVTRGMKFHMPGRWVVTYVVEGAAGSDRAQVDVRL